MLSDLESIDKSKRKENVKRKNSLIKCTITIAASLWFGLLPVSGQQAETAEPVIIECDAFIPIPNGAVMPQKYMEYKAIYDATVGAENPDDLLPALYMAGSEVNILAANGVPLSQI